MRFLQHFRLFILQWRFELKILQPFMKLLKNRKAEKVDLRSSIHSFHEKRTSLINIMKFKYLSMIVYFFDLTVQNIEFN